MNLLVTAGNTQAPIDRVRCLTNIFTGRTGAGIALEAHRRGHRVTLLTSHPEAVVYLRAEGVPAGEHWHLEEYRTFQDLRALLEQHVAGGNYQAVIHSAAVSDYLAGGVFAPAPATHFALPQAHWQAERGNPPAMVEHAAGKIKSNEPELWLRLLRAPKLIDLVRPAWGFNGVLVKFKLEVGAGDEQLLAVAEKSRTHSRADLMVANTLEGAMEWAYLGPLAAGYERVPRRLLPERLLEAVEQRVKSHG